MTDQKGSRAGAVSRARAYVTEGAFEADLLRELRGPKNALLATIKKEEKLTDASEGELKDVIQTVKNRFI